MLIFDEATSALDTETEEAVVQSIKKLTGSKNIIIIAHRLNTLKDCDEIYEVKEGEIHLRNKDEVFA